MRTNQVMESIDRELEGKIVAQRTKDGFLCLGDVLGIVNLDRISQGKQPIAIWNFLQSENVSIFCDALEKETKAPIYHKATKISRGWIHPFLALKLLTYYNPKFEIQVYKWLFDYLIDNRIKSSDSYIRMCGVIAKYNVNKSKIQVCIQWTANKIKEIIGVEDWNKASQEQLKHRDDLQNLIADLIESLGDCKLGFKYAIRADSRKNGGKYADLKI